MNKKFKILICDDQLYIRNIIRLKLEKLGFEIIEAQNGKDGLDFIKRLNPDLVILDLMMPEMDGFEVLRWIKSDIKYNSTKIMILSSKGQQADIDTAYKLGADKYFCQTV